MAHCLDGAACSDHTCFLKHPCPGRDCHHYGKVWLAPEHSKYNHKKRFKTCKQLASKQTRNAATKERKRKQREEAELETIPEHDLSAEAKAVALASAMRSLQAVLARMCLRYPGRVLSCNVFGASTGSEGYSIVQEGATSTLTEHGYGTPAIVAPSTLSGAWRALSGHERRTLGPPAATVFDAGHSKEMSKHVERELQLYVEQVHGIQQLWRVAGAGGPKGLPPYCVGVRFIPHEADGSLPHGFYHTI